MRENADAVDALALGDEVGDERAARPRASASEETAPAAVSISTPLARVSSAGRALGDEPAARR